MILDHPMWQKVLPYLKPPNQGEKGRKNIDFSLIGEILAEALSVRTACVACQKEMSPFRDRKQSRKGPTESRVAGTPTASHVFYSGACTQNENMGCSRTKLAKKHKRTVLASLGIVEVPTRSRAWLLVELEDVRQRLRRANSTIEAQQRDLEDARQSLRIAEEIFNEEMSKASP